MVNLSSINKTQNLTNLTPKNVSNASGKVVDNSGAYLECDISIRSSEGMVKEQTKEVTQYNSLITNSDVITFDARRSKNVSAKFKILTGSEDGNVVLDNFGKVKPANVREPEFSALKYVEIHAENLSYDTVEITVTYTDEELAGFDENKLVLYHYTYGNWIPLTTTVDTISNTLTAYVSSLSIFAIGQGTGINVYSQIDEHVNPNTTVVISGAIYYDNLTAVDGASVYVNITSEAISKSVTSDSDGNFKLSFPAPSNVGDYVVMVNATLGSMSVNSTKSLEVTNSPHFKLTGEISVTNQDVVAPGSNITIEYGVPFGAVADNSTITISGKTNVEGNKIYHIYTDKKVDYGVNASGTYTFLVDSVPGSNITITSGNIITNILSSSLETISEDVHRTYLDSAQVESSHIIKTYDHSTWYWSIDVKNYIIYNQLQTIDTVAIYSGIQARFNASSNLDVGFTASGLSKPTNTSFYVDNIKLISTSGDLGSESANMTGYMNDTTDLTITSDTQGGVEYTTFTSFHDDLDASLVNTGPNYIATLSVTNDDINGWDNVKFYYDVPQGGYNIVVTDTDNNINHTSNCTIPLDGGDVVIPSSVVDTIHSGSSREFTIGYSLKQLNVTTVTDKHTYAPGQNIIFTTDVFYNDSLTSDAVVWVQVRDPEDVLVINANATWDGSNYSLTNTTDQAWKVGIYHVTVNATQTIDGIERTGIYNTSFAEKKLIMYVQGNGPYLRCCNITIDGRAFYSDNTVASGEVVNITVGSTNTSAVANATGYYNVAIPGFEPGTYNVNATITDGLGLTDTDDDTVMILEEPFFVLVDSDLTEMSGQVLMTTNHTFSIDIPSDIDVLSSTINLTGITEKTIEFDVSPPLIAMAQIGTTQFNFVNGTFNVIIPPYKSVIINDFNMTVTAFPVIPIAIGTQEAVFNNSIDGIDVGDGHYVVPDTPSTHSWSDDITSRVSSGIDHEIRITKLGTSINDYRFLVMGYVNQTGFLDTPVNPRAYVDGNIVYAESGDMLTSSHVTDITKYMHAG
ncbi:MAG: hypothetical protein Q7J10_09425, partial [Methanosarcinaceae archaeon]|nr:hypothetical protein [Methanosarcinaceae archaeon]